MIKVNSNCCSRVERFCSTVERRMSVRNEYWKKTCVAVSCSVSSLSSALLAMPVMHWRTGHVCQHRTRFPYICGCGHRAYANVWLGHVGFKKTRSFYIWVHLGRWFAFSHKFRSLNPAHIEPHTDRSPRQVGLQVVLGAVGLV